MPVTVGRWATFSAIPALEPPRTARGALCGALAAAVWAFAQPLDKLVFKSSYDDVELIGRGLTRGELWYPLGFAVHVLNGALFGAVYANLAPSLPMPPFTRGPALALAEHLAFWPLGGLSDRLHPARDGSPRSPAIAARSDKRPGVTCCSASCSGSSIVARGSVRNDVGRTPSPLFEQRARLIRRRDARAAHISSLRPGLVRTVGRVPVLSRPAVPVGLPSPPRARLAQPVEHFTCNEGVGGSSPPAGLGIWRFVSRICPQSRV